MKKKIADLKLVRKKRLTPYHFVLILESLEKLPDINPGQFAEVLVENTKNVFLRRPLSIHDVDFETNRITFLVQIVGNGTRALAYLEEGDFLNVVFPLGNSFSLPDKGNLLLVGGGCGVAPLLYLARRLSENQVYSSILIGGKTKQDILLIEEYEKLGTVYTTTEDGSYGEKGMVTDHSVLKYPDFDMIYACGPEPMMRAIAAHAKENDTECEVTLENTMACGIGACLCCVVETVKGNVCTCTDGPVFNINDLKW